MEFLTPEIAISFITLSLLEIVLGIDNLIFIALVVQKLPKEMAKKVRFIGLSLAMIIRIAMLLGITWIMSLTNPIFSIGENSFSVKDLLLLAGGLFLIGKSTLEMHVDISGREPEHKDIKAKASMMGAVVQVALIDFVFSFDSIITAVGLTPNTGVIIAAIVVSMIVMLMAAGYISHFLKEHPTFKMLALSFILMIGILLMAEGMHFHIPRGYIYFAFAFSILVEGLNTVARKKRQN